MGIRLGIDGGGSKTDFLGYRPGEPEPIAARRGGTSLSRGSEAAVAAELEGGCSEILGASGAQPGDCAAVCAGFASASLHHEAYERLLRRLLPRARLRVLTDAELAWHAATGGNDGIVVIAGTGSIAWGCYATRQARSGGEGPGRDPGSGDWIGREAVRAGLAPPPRDGNFAALVPELAANPAATPIFQRAGLELAALLTACARQLGWSAPIAYATGGVLSHVPQVRAALAAAWPHSLLQPARAPVEAALELAQ